MAVFFTDAVDVTPGTAGSWVDADLSAYVPSEATAVIVAIVNPSVYAWAAGVRCNGSSDDRAVSCGAYRSHWHVRKCDASQKVEVYSSSPIRGYFFLVGYFTDDGVFFTNAYDKSLGSYGSWLDIDCSGQVPAGAVGVALEAMRPGGTGTSSGVGYRCNGSTDSRHLPAGETVGYCIGCDANRKIEGYISDANDDCFLHGYFLDPTSFQTNGSLRTTTVNTWEDMTAAPAGAVGQALERNRGASANYSYVARKNGSADDWFSLGAGRIYRNDVLLVGCDGSQISEGYRNLAAQEFYYLGCFGEPAPAPEADDLLMAIV